MRAGQYILVLFLIFGRVDAQSPAAQRPDNSDIQKIGMALSGGGAHGLAHIGVMKYLEEMGVEIDYITGTSMGAIVGGMYAMGYNTKDVVEITSRMDWDAILGNRVTLDAVSPYEKYLHDKYPLRVLVKNGEIGLPIGFINSSRLDVVLKEIFFPAYGVKDFEKLPIPFNCFGVDIENGEVVRLHNGNLSEAIRASMAIPSVFAPKEYQGRFIVDGGLIRNFPVSNNFDMGSDIVIGSYVGREKADRSSLNSLLDILTESAFMMSISDSETQKELTDVLIQPNVKEMGTFDFDNWEAFIEKGYHAAKLNHENLEKAIGRTLPIDQDDNHAEPMSDPGFLFIDSISVPNVTEAYRKLILDKLDIQRRSYTSFDNLRLGVDRIKATKNFDDVSFDIVSRETSKCLVINTAPKRVGDLGVNINHFGNTNSALVLNAELRNQFGRLSNLIIAGRISDNPGLNVNYAIRTGPWSKNIILGFRTKVEKYSLDFYDRGKAQRNGSTWESYFQPFAMYELNNFASVELHFDNRRFNFNNELLRDEDIDDIRSTRQKIGLSYEYTNMPRRHFSQEGTIFWIKTGYAIDVDEQINFTTMGIPPNIIIPEAEDYFEGELNLSKTISLSNTSQFRFTNNLYYRSSSTFLDTYQIGGTFQERYKTLPFIGGVLGEFQTDQHVYLRGELRTKMFDLMYLSAIVNYLTAESVHRSYISDGGNTTYDVIGAGIELGIDLPIGPIIFDLGYNSLSDDVVSQFSIGWRHIY